MKREPQRIELERHLIGRRDFLRLAGGMAGGLAASSFLAACGPAPATEVPTAAAAAVASATPIPPTAKPTVPQILLYGGKQEVENIDPCVGTGSYSNGRIMDALYDPLVVVRGNPPQISPLLVEKWQASPDAQEWTFNLTTKARFHDGSPVTAEAVKYTFDRLLGLQEAHIVALWQGIMDQAGVSVVDEHTFKIVLKEPSPILLDTLQHVRILNPRLVKDNEGSDYGKSWLVEHEAGSGPFAIGRWEPGTLYELEAVPDYWGAWPVGGQLDGLIWKVVRESASQKLALLGSEIHVADGLSDDDIVEVSGKPGFVVEDHETLNTFYLKMNCQKGPTADRNVRLAIAHLLDYGQFQAALNNRVTMLTGPMPPAVKPQVPGLAVPTYDPAKAKEYLAASQYPDGGFELEYIPISGVESERIPGLMLLDELQKLNITLNIREVTWSELVDAVSTVETCPNLVPIYTNGSGITHADRWLYSQFHSDFWGSFFTCSFYKNEEVDSILYEAHTTSDPAKQEELYSKAQELLVADAPAIWGFTTKSAIAMSDEVKGFEFCPTADVGVEFRTLWLQA